MTPPDPTPEPDPPTVEPTSRVARPVWRPANDDFNPRRRYDRDDGPPPRRPDPRYGSAYGAWVTVGFYVAFVLSIVGLVFAVAVSIGVSIARGDTLPDDPEIKRKVLIFTAVLEAFDAVLVLVACVVAGRPPEREPRGSKLAVWLAAFPVLAVALGFNFLYQWMIRSLAGVDEVEMGFDVEWGVIGVLLVCVQPAVVEEIFFRYLMLGHLRPFLGAQPAIWLTAVLFGVAHLGQPGAMPVLVLVGAGLGYARVYGGGMALPVILHFVHNFVVLAVHTGMK